MKDDESYIFDLPEKLVRPFDKDPRWKRVLHYLWRIWANTCGITAIVIGLSCALTDFHEFPVYDQEKVLITWATIFIAVVLFKLLFRKEN